MQHTTLHKLFRLFPALIVILSGLLTVPVAFAQDGGAPDTDPLSHVEFTGTILAVEGDTLLTVDEVQVDAAEAEVSVPLDIGAVVKVEGTLGEAGLVLATEIGAPDPVSDEDTPSDNPDLELTGTLESLDETTAVVDGLSFDVTGAEVAPGLVEGDLVKVEANFDTETGLWMATELRLADLDGDGDVDADDDALADDTGDDDSADDDDSVGDDDSEDVGDDDTGLCVFGIEVSSANLRNGPGTGYDVIGFAFEDQELPVTGIHTSGDWFTVTTDEGEAWVAASVGELHGDCSGLLVLDTPFQGGDEVTTGGDDGDDDDDSVMSDDDGDDDDDDDDGISGDDGSGDDDDDDDDDGGDDSPDDEVEDD